MREPQHGGDRQPRQNRSMSRAAEAASSIAQLYQVAVCVFTSVRTIEQLKSAHRQLPVGVCSGGKHSPCGGFFPLNSAPACDGLSLIELCAFRPKSTHRHQSKMECVCSDGSPRAILASACTNWDRNNRCGSSNRLAAPRRNVFALLCRGCGVGECIGPHSGLCCCGRKHHCLLVPLRSCLLTEGDHTVDLLALEIYVIVAAVSVERLSPR